MIKSKKIVSVILSFVAAICLACGLTTLKSSGVHAETATVLTDKDAFISEIKANPNGNFELGADIDFGGETLSESIVFGGTLDGKGYALKNFKLGIAEANGWNSRFISENNGTIKNIGLYISSVQANNNEFGFIRANKGTVSNVFVNFNYDSTQIINQYCHYGTIAMQNDGGTIENCVVNVIVAEGVDIGVGQGDGGVNIFAAISAYNVNGGVIRNCHAVIGDNNIGIAIYPWATQENNATYATMAELAAAITFNSENGWNTEIWTVENGEVKMSHPVIPASPTVLTQADVANFKTLLNGSSGSFVLGEDLDFGNAQTAGVINFKGTLDGNGYALKNLLVHYDARNDGWESYLFAENTGTIRNLGVHYTLKANGSKSSLIYQNSGTVSNVFVKVSVTGDDGWTLGAIINTNDGGTVENCITVISEDSTGTANFGSIVGVDKLGTIKNCYSVTNGKITSDKPNAAENGKGIYENNANYTTMAELAAAITFNSENGWNTEYTDRLFAEVVAIQNAGNEISSLAVLSRGAASCEDDRVADFAAEDLKYYFRLITGKTLNVKTISSLSELDAGVKYFVLGKELAEEAALSFEGLTTETGYIVQKTENGIYLYGNTAYGTLNAVYAMLNQAFGLEIYTDEVYTADRDSFEYSRVADRAVFNPSIDKMWAQNGALNANSNFTYQRRLGYVNSWQEVNGTYHNFLEVIKKSVYGTEHPEWFVTVTATDSKQPFETLCLTAGGDDMAAIVAKYARDEILAQDATGNVKDIFVFGQPDARGWCDCSASAAVKNNYGANSAEYIVFMNKVAKIFEDNYAAEIGRKITFMLMAYNAALEAPAKNLSELKLYDTDKAAVAAMVAMIEGNSYRELKDDVLSKKYGHSNRYFLDQFNVWKSLGKAYFWRYSAYFDNYFVPIDTISNMQATYKAIAESGAEVLVDQGVSGVKGATDFDALKIYLKAKLAKDVNADVEMLIKNFCNAYYGAGGEKMYEFLTVYRAWYKTLDGKTTSSNKDALGCHMIGGMDIFNKKYWDDTPSGTIFKSYDASMLKGWYANYIEAALNLVKADSDYAKRIKTEGLFVRYMAYAVYGDSTYGDFAAIATDAKALGIERFAEGNAYVKSGNYVDGSIDNLQ